LGGLFMVRLSLIEDVKGQAPQIWWASHVNRWLSRRSDPKAYEERRQQETKDGPSPRAESDRPTGSGRGTEQRRPPDTGRTCPAERRLFTIKVGRKVKLLIIRSP
jgi:hypothetical protein